MSVSSALLRTALPQDDQARNLVVINGTDARAISPRSASASINA
jgi:hypothetical protein